MAKIQNSKVVPLKLGDRVRIKDFGGKIGRIAELRGPLGPGGAAVYRVLVQRKPTVSYIELLGDQLEFAPLAGQTVRVKQVKSTPRTKKGV
jgi:hypothetical protein